MTMTLAEVILAVGSAEPTALARTVAEGARGLTGADVAIARVEGPRGPEIAVAGVDGTPSEREVDALIAGADAHVEPIDAGDAASYFVALVGAGPSPELTALARFLGTLLGQRALGRAVRSTRNMYRTLIEQLPAATYYRSIDTPGTPSFMSPQIERIIGYSPSEVLADAEIWRRHIHPDDVAHVQVGLASFDPAASTEPLRAEYRMIHKDGHVVWIENYALAVRDEAGRPSFVIGLLFDATARRELEAELRRAQKLEAVGQLAGGVAHDFNNLLSVVLAYGEGLVASLPHGDPRRDDAREIVQAGERARDMVRQLLALGQRQMLVLRTLDLRQLATRLAPSLRATLGSRVELELELGATCHLVRADPSQLELVLSNLVANAREAMPRGGRARLEVGDVRLDDAFHRAHPRVEPGLYVRLAVVDDGAGMDAETRARAFEPFFTTHDRARRSGLGLATALGIVQQMGGTMTLASEPRRGTTVEVLLPAALEEPAVTLPHAGTALPRGLETVLLAEDDEQVRRLVRALLQRLGYTVLAAEDGVEALALSDAHDGPIELLLTDVVMPRLSGFELAQRLAARRPDTRVAFMSGYNDEAVGLHGIPADAVILQKPFSVGELSVRLRAVLDG